MDAATVKRIAHLARIALPPEEIAATAESLERIMELIARMQSVSTDTVPVMAHPLDLQQPLREDVLRSASERELLMGSAPAASDGLFLVPKVIE